MEKEPRKYTEEFKKQIVELHENGKTVIELASEYG
ncbi:MAG: transposase, partial [Treponema sp.]|nr:transposase [Treponema sp.]